LDSDETILVHGIIDCWFEDNGGIVIVDYKSDALPAGGVPALVDEYRTQMSVYVKALEGITGRAPSEALLYLFAVDSEVKVDVAILTTGG